MKPFSMNRLASSTLARLTQADRLEHMYREVDPALDAASFSREALRALGVSFSLDIAELERVPAEGPVIIACNHPYGGIDGLAAIAALMARRPDLLVVATSVLERISQLAPLLVCVENRGPRPSVHLNACALRRALREVSGGRALLLFPAGVVSHLDLRGRCIVDPPWRRSVVRFLVAARAPVVPMHVSGCNGPGFQLAGLIHPALRTALLPRELLNKRGARLRLRIGDALPADKISALDQNDRLEAHVRVRLYSLAAPRHFDGPSRTAIEPGTRGGWAPIAAPPDSETLAQEITTLAPSSRLLALGPIEVYCAPAQALPSTLREIGRLREITFRSVGEGTGKAVDLDPFDARYDHLFAWDSSARCVVGAYRIGRMDELRRAHGRGACYLETLFEFRDPVFALLGPTLELGRSFVRAEYQKSFAPLLALWRGIGEYVGRHPRYVRLLGPVSISADYGILGRDLLLRYLRQHHYDPLLAAMVRPRTPARPVPGLATLGPALATVANVEAISELMADGTDTGSQRGVPVLLRQYLKLGGRVLGFNIDPAFGDCIDCLTLVDLRRTPPDSLSRFMSSEARAATGLQGKRQPD